MLELRVTIIHKKLENLAVYCRASERGEGEVGVVRKKIFHTHIHTYTRHPNYLSRASQHARGTTKNQPDQFSNFMSSGPVKSVAGQIVINGDRSSVPCFLQQVVADS